MPIIKTKLDIPQQIEHMKQKGIKFTILTEQDARKILTESNYYFRLKSYAKNYEKYTNAKDTKKNGTYINLEFAYLYELSVLDMHLRNILLMMTITIEHFLKHTLLSDISSNSAEDGYGIIAEFFTKYSDIKTKIDEIANTAGYNSTLAKKYKSAMPVWVIVELLSFGDIIKLYKFYHEKYQKNNSTVPFLWSTRMLRNASAHNSCLLHELTQTNFTNITQPAADIVARKCAISKHSILKKFSNRLIHDSTVMIVLYQKIVTSDSVKAKQAEELMKFCERCSKHTDYFRYNNRIQKNVLFAKKILDNFMH